MGSWGYDPTYRGYNSICNWLGPTLYIPLIFQKNLPQTKSQKQDQQLEQHEIWLGIFLVKLQVGVRSLNNVSYLKMLGGNSCLPFGSEIFLLEIMDFYTWVNN